MNTYSDLRRLAKQNKYQNLFFACKELEGFRLFKNSRDLSQLQQIFINYLYMYSSIIQAISVDKISPHVIDCELYEDSYLLWRNKGVKKDKKDDKQNDVHLVASDTIIFPKKNLGDN